MYSLRIPLRHCGRVATSSARQLSVAPARHIQKTQVLGVRCLSSRAAAGNPATHNARLFGVLATSASAAAGVYLFVRSQDPYRMDCDCCAPKSKPTGSTQASVKQTPISIVSRDTPKKGADSRLNPIEPLHDESLELSHLPEEEAIMTAAPLLPPRITRDYPVLLKVTLTTVPKMAQLTSQYKYEQWTFNNTVPGPFIRARVGDVVEVALTNKDPAGNPHNIDCHAFTGPGGGAAVTTAEENQTKTARFKLQYPGLYIYHCAAAPVPVHIANGMYGLMYVQPEKGDLPPVDREYFVMQSEFYHEPPEINDDGRRSDVVEFSYPNGLREEPNVVVFNGSESALTRDRPLKANVGETVRVFFGNAGPNLTSAFHIIGSHFRNVYREGDVVSPPGRFVSTVSVPPGAATIVDLKMDVPGTYSLVDHSMFRLDKGAVGFLNVSGSPRPDIYQSTQPPAPCSGCKLHA